MVHIENGTRYIITNVKGGTVLGLSNADERSIVCSHRYGSRHQQWEMIRVQGGWYIQNVAGGQFLRIDGQPEDHTSLVASHEPFVWQIKDDEADHSTMRICVPHTIQNVDLSHCGNIIVRRQWAEENQTWKVEQVLNTANIENTGRYIITNVQSGTVMDLSKADNKSVIGFKRHGGKNQQWEMIRADGGWYIKNVAGGRFLGIDGHANNNTRVVATRTPFVWQIRDDETDCSTIRICVPNTRQNVDLSNHGSPAPLTPIIIWGHWAGKNQTWKVERV